MRRLFAMREWIIITEPRARTCCVCWLVRWKRLSAPSAALLMGVDAPPMRLQEFRNRKASNKNVVIKEKTQHVYSKSVCVCLYMYASSDQRHLDDVIEK